MRESSKITLGITLTFAQLALIMLAIWRLPDSGKQNPQGFLSGQTGCFDWRTVRLYTDAKGFTTVTGLVVPCNDPRAHTPKPIEIR